MNQLDVKTSKLPIVMTILLGLFFVPMAFGLLISGVSKGFAAVPMGIGVMSIVLFTVVLMIVLRGHLNSVKTFNEGGLTRHDGRKFWWADLLRIEEQVRTSPGGRKAIWRTELQFRDGHSAWLIPTKISNFSEVYSYVNSLPCERVEKVVGTLR